MQQSRTGLWATLCVAVAVALLFLILWLVRGGDNADLAKRLAEATGKLDKATADLGDLERKAKSQQADAERAVKELTDKLQAEKRRLESLDSDAGTQRTEVARLTALAEERAREAAANKKLAAEQEALAKSLADKLAASEKALADEREGGTKATTQGQAALASAKNVWDKEKADLQAGIRKLEADLAALRGELTKSGEALKTLKAASLADLAKAREDAENAGAALAKAEADLQALRAAGAADADAAAKAEIDRLKAELARAEKAGAEGQKTIALLDGLASSLRENENRLKDELAAALDHGRELETAMKAGNGAEAKKFKEMLERVERELAEANAKLAEETRLKNESIQALARARELEAAAKAGGDAEAKKLEAEAKKLREALERAERGLAEAEQAHKKALAASEKNAQADLQRATQDTAALEAKYRADIRNLENAAAALEKELKEAREKHKGDLGRLEAAAAEALKAREDLAGKLKKALDDLAKLKERLAAAESEAAENAETIAALRASAESSPAQPERFVGEVVSLDNSLKVLTINRGGKQNVRPGLKFDIYRRNGDRLTYLGMAKVVRALTDSSIAVHEPVTGDTLICPETGLAVFEAGARFSPFAKGKGGEAVRLVPAREMDLVTPLPQPGDLLVNPFFHPDRPMAFFLADEVCASPEAGRALVHRLGGMPTATLGSGTDVVVVPCVDPAKAGELELTKKAREAKVPVAPVTDLLRYVAE